ncbi:MAG: hypothetical protein M9894_19060 [Planctomycetes bacterium]|nr:hypothetical protein [Planctomycetota bacterium]
MVDGPADDEGGREAARPEATAAGRLDAAAAALLRRVFVPLCLLLPAATYARLWFGVDVTDEAFYVAMAHGFASGSRPFVDEYSITQTAALGLTPLVWAYERLVGSTEGLVLFVRHLFFALQAGTALVVFARLREEVPRPVAAATAALVFAFVPFSIPSVSYNTAGALLLTAGLLAATFRRRLPWRLEQVAAGLALGGAAFAYPPLAPAVGVALAVTARRDRAALPGLCAGLAVPLALALALVAHATPSRVLEATAFLSTSRTTEGLEKVQVIARGAWEALPVEGPARYALALLLVAAALSGRAAAVALPTLALAFAVRLDGALPRGQLLLAFVALLGPALRVRRASDAGGVWAVSFVAAACTSHASSNGFTNACLGLLPALLCAVAWAARAADERPGERGAGARASLAAGCCLVVATLGAAPFTYVYRDAPLSQLTATVDAGAYRGLRTTPARRDLLGQVARDLAAASADRRSIFVFDDFPAGYLLTDLVPRGPGMWISSPSYSQVDRRFYVRSFDEDGPPDVVLLYEPFPDAARPAHDPLRARFAPPAYDVVVEREGYSVLARRR